MPFGNWVQFSLVNGNFVVFQQKKENLEMLFIANLFHSYLENDNLPTGN